MLERTGLWAVLVVGVGCAAPVEPSANAGYVLLDRQARAVGTLSIGDFHGAPRLPVWAEAGDVVQFDGSDGPVSIDIRPGLIAYIHSSRGSIEWVRLGADARAGSLLLESDAAAAFTLARTVGAKTIAVGNRFRIAIPDAYFKLAFSNEPEGLDQAIPDYEPDEGATSTKPHPTENAGGDPAPGVSYQSSATDRALQAVRVAGDFVGVYLHGDGLLVLDASGHYAYDTRCPGDDGPAGRYWVSAGRVVLEGTGTLETDGDDLLDTSGIRFALMRPEEPRTRTPVRGLSAILEER